MVWLFVLPLRAEGEDVFDQRIRLTTGKGTVYRLLGEVSDRSGYLFIYDSRLIDDEETVRIKTGDYTVRQAITEIVRNPDIDMRVVGKHILLFKPDKEITTFPVLSAETPIEPVAVADTFFTIEGVIRDQFTDAPIPYVSIGLIDYPIGTISNQNGEFRIRLSNVYRNSQLYISHLGYEPQNISNDVLVGSHIQIRLEPKVIPLQEVVIRIANPRRIIEDMIDKRKDNYAKAPVYHTSFYREGVEYKNQFINLTEAVMRIYKTPYETATDQVKLLKMRSITNDAETDTLITKFKSGIDACLMLDLIKHMPDFLLLDKNNTYIYSNSDITVIDNRLAHVITFEQDKYEREPMYKGEVYIDSENDALIGATFEINPKYVEKTTDRYITKKSRSISITPQKIAYSVQYKEWNGIYYINHIRGDLHFKIKKKGHLFNNAPLHIWFEMVNCHTDVSDVSRFSRNEVLSTRTVFAETKYAYDESFWGNFNIIQPEEQLNESINKISAKIEETGY